MKNKAKPAQSSDNKLDQLLVLIEQLVAIQLYSGGATQKQIADNLGISVGKVNSLVKGMKTPKEPHGQKD